MNISKDILDLVPYKPGKSISETKREFGLSRVYKLGSNENALGPSPKVVEAVKRAVEQAHRYPDPTSFDLTQALSEKWSVPKECILLGNGSNELIDLLIRLLCEPGESISIFDSSFVAYEVCAQAARVNVKKIPMKGLYEVQLDQLWQEIDQSSSLKLVFLPNPNNPTGRLIPQKELNELIQKVQNQDKVLLVVDEAYHEFVRDSSYESQLGQFDPNGSVAVLRTFSKAYGMAGLRLGAFIGPTSISDLLHRIRNPFNVNNLSQAAALAALEDHDYLRASRELVFEQRDRAYGFLNELGWDSVPSEGNFICFKAPKMGDEFCLELLKRGVVLRPLMNYKMGPWVRMSIGTSDEMSQTFDAIRKVIG